MAGLRRHKNPSHSALNATFNARIPPLYLAVQLRGRSVIV